MDYVSSLEYMCFYERLTSINYPIRNWLRTLTSFAITIIVTFVANMFPFPYDEPEYEKPEIQVLRILVM